MNPFNSLRNLFTKKARVSTQQEQQWLEGVHAFKKGSKLFRENKHQEALDCFDRAIECGFGGEGIYGLRAWSLQGLGFHLDAVDDFLKAISLAPEEADLYFGCSISRSATGDFAGCVSDLQEAIRLSKLDNEYNDFWNNYAKETGWPSATAHYEMDLVDAQWTSEFHKKHPEAHQVWKERNEKDSVRWRRRPNPGGSITCGGETSQEPFSTTGGAHNDS
jgi:tetratricopeptide (TPR) repeat protein